MRITIKKKFVIFLKLFEWISNFSFDISQSSIGHLLQNGSLKLNVIKLFLLFFITHTGGTPPPPNTPFLTYPQQPACVILTLLGFSINIIFSASNLSQQFWRSCICSKSCLAFEVIFEVTIFRELHKKEQHAGYLTQSYSPD